MCVCLQDEPRLPLRKGPRTTTCVRVAADHPVGREGGRARDTALGAELPRGPRLCVEGGRAARRQRGGS